MKTNYLQLLSRTSIGLGLLAIGLGSSISQATDVYRWKDANGDYHYGDQRSAPQGASKMTVDTPEQQPNPELDKYRQAVRANLAELDAQREQAAKAQAAQQLIANGVHQNCQQLRNAIRVEENVAVLFTFDDKGEKQYLDDKQRAEYKSTLNQQWQRRCN
jgi:hypothetical protein